MSQACLPGNSKQVKIQEITPEVLLGLDRRRLKRGVLYAQLPPRAPHVTRTAHPWASQPSTVSCGTLWFPKLPVEILKNILGYLEPIWLFQVAAAYSEIEAILSFETSNRLWYDALPAALYLEPENFQDEMTLKHRMFVYSGQRRSQAPFQPSHDRFVYDAFHFPESHASRFVLPAVTGLSELSRTLDFSVDSSHPTDRRFYPSTPTRNRNMALGGPFQPWFDYRREMAGHLHYGMRCIVCFQLIGKIRLWRKIGGNAWCLHCFTDYTLSAVQVLQIPGLKKLLERYPHPSSVELGLHCSESHYRPVVDDLLKWKIGLDFETAHSMQMYINQLLKTWKGNALSTSLERARRGIRQKIVLAAQEIWSKTYLTQEEKSAFATTNPAGKKRLAKMIIIQARDRWAPTSELGKFLFPSRLLHDTALCVADPQEAEWLPDPTQNIKSSRQVVQINDRWIEDTAHSMINNLVACHRDAIHVSTWVKAATDWHVCRLLRDIWSGKYLNLSHGGDHFAQLQQNLALNKNRLEIIARKLRIDPSLPTGTLTRYERKQATACFNKILIARCVACPKHNLLILASGLEGVVSHHRHHHPLNFYLSDKWIIRG